MRYHRRRLKEGLLKLFSSLKQSVTERIVAGGYEQLGFNVVKEEAEKMVCHRYFMLCTTFMVETKGFW